MNEDINILESNLQHACILVVDDELANLKLIDKLLQNTGYNNIICTQNPVEVATLYQNNNIDLILLDINMPVLDGFGVMEQLNALKDNHDSPPILVLTAQHAQEYRQHALDLGARDYITKPFNAQELFARVRNLLEVRIANNSLKNQNTILESAVMERTKELRSTQLQVIRHLARAAEYRDNETGLHIIRMSKMAMEIGKYSGMDNYQCELLLNSAPMHDIGKIGIPDHILLKPGKFDPPEWEIMKTHVQIGAEVLSGDQSELMIMAHDIALSHHEKWNGQGYPFGLKGEEIPLVGRITALADVFDALTSSRPYKKAWTIEEAVKLIKSERGEHFEPRLVDVFLDILPKLVNIKEEHEEPG